MAARRSDSFPRLAALLLILAGATLYANSLDAPFLFDDHDAIVRNPHIHHLWPLREALTAPPQTAASGRPVVSLSLALNYAAGGLDVRGYRLFNLGVHLGCALLLLGLIRRTLRCDVVSARLRRAADPLAFAAAGLWLVHPLQSECVNYIIQRTESLMALFYLLTLYTAMRGAVSERSRLWFLGSVVACALGMATKEVMVTAPVMVLLYHWTFDPQPIRDLLRRRWGLYAGLAATWGLLAGLLATGGRSQSIGFVHGVTPLEYAWNQGVVLVHYLRLSLWPHPLVIDYGPAEPIGVWQGAPAAALVMALLALTGWALWRRPAWGFLGAWFFLLLAPTSSFVPIVTEVTAERRLYLPLAAIVVLLVLVTHTVLGRLGARRAAGVLLAAVAIALAAATFARNRDYRSAVTIWRTAVEQRPRNARAHYSLGTALLGEGAVTDAIAHYQRAIELQPNLALIHYNLANALRAKGDIEGAMGAYRRALELNPDFAEAHNNLGMLLRARGQLEQAIHHYRRALERKPGFARAHNNLGVALQSAGRLEEATAHYRRAIEIDPGYAAAHANLGNALRRLGRRQEALFHLREASRLKGSLPR